VSVRVLDAQTLVLEGECPSQDAEALLRHLLAMPGATVDWRDCREAHTAVVQVLLASPGPIVGPPANDFLRDMVEPALFAR
jgi:hypothetical protein